MTQIPPTDLTVRIGRLPRQVRTNEFIQHLENARRLTVVVDRWTADPAAMAVLRRITKGNLDITENLTVRVKTFTGIPVEVWNALWCIAKRSIEFVWDATEASSSTPPRTDLAFETGQTQLSQMIRSDGHIAIERASLTGYFDTSVFEALCDRRTVFDVLRIDVWHDHIKTLNRSRRCSARRLILSPHRSQSQEDEYTRAFWISVAEDEDIEDLVIMDSTRWSLGVGGDLSENPPDIKPVPGRSLWFHGYEVSSEWKFLIDATTENIHVVVPDLVSGEKKYLTEILSYVRGAIGIARLRREKGNFNRMLYAVNMTLTQGTPISDIISWIIKCLPADENLTEDEKEPFILQLRVHCENPQIMIAFYDILGYRCRLQLRRGVLAVTSA